MSALLMNDGLDSVSLLLFLLLIPLVLIEMYSLFVLDSAYF